MGAGVNLGKQQRNIRAVLQYFRLTGEMREAAAPSVDAGAPPEFPWLRLGPSCPKSCDVYIPPGMSEMSLARC